MATQKTGATELPWLENFTHDFSWSACGLAQNRRVMAHWKKRETLFAEYGIELRMPGAWQLRPSSNPVSWLYRSADHREHLTISRGEIATPRAGASQNPEHERALTRQRKAVELGFARVPDLAMGEPEHGERGGVPAAWYQGQAGGQHVFSALMLFSQGTVWTFFHEAFRMREEDAQASADAIFDSVILHD